MDACLSFFSFLFESNNARRIHDQTRASTSIYRLNYININQHEDEREMRGGQRIPFTLSAIRDDPELECDEYVARIASSIVDQIACQVFRFG